MSTSTVHVPARVARPLQGSGRAKLVTREAPKLPATVHPPNLTAQRRALVQSILKHEGDILGLKATRGYATLSSFCGEIDRGERPGFVALWEDLNGWADRVFDGRGTAGVESCSMFSRMAIIHSAFEERSFDFEAESKRFLARWDRWSRRHLKEAVFDERLRKVMSRLRSRREYVAAYSAAINEGSSDLQEVVLKMSRSLSVR